MMIYVHTTKMPSAILTVDYDKTWEVWDKAHGMFFSFSPLPSQFFPTILLPPFFSHHWYLLSTHQP
jgi:hypothetical protein